MTNRNADKPDSNLVSISDNNFIILRKNKDADAKGYDGGFHPTRFSDGSLVIYGSYEEALEDSEHGEDDKEGYIIARLLFPQWTYKPYTHNKK